jgi:hypothetical protein
MLATIDFGDVTQADPVHWPPFVVAGEGTAGN